MLNIKNITKEQLLNYAKEIQSPILEMLVESVEPKTIIKLMQFYGGMDLYIPMIDGLQAKIRNQNMIQDFHENHLDYNLLSQKYGISARYARGIIAKSENETSNRMNR